MQIIGVGIGHESHRSNGSRIGNKDRYLPHFFHNVLKRCFHVRTYGEVRDLVKNLSLVTRGSGSNFESILTAAKNGYRCCAGSAKGRRDGFPDTRSTAGNEDVLASGGQLRTSR